MTKKMMLALVAMASVAVLAGCGTHTEETVTDATTGEVVETMTGEVMEVVETMTGETMDVVVEEPTTGEVAAPETTEEVAVEVTTEDVATGAAQ